MHTALAQLTSGDDTTRVCWLGNIGWLVGVGGRLIGFDLDIERDSRVVPSPIPLAEIADVLEMLFITHEHEDHFATPTCRVLARNPECLFVVPANCAAKARSLGVDADRLTVAHPREPLELPGMTVHPLRAIHGHHRGTVYRNANLDDCGYLIDCGGVRIMQPGDTLLLDEHRDIANVDILFVSPTEHNMFVKHAIHLIESVRPRFVFPQHYGTYEETDSNRYWTRGYPDELGAALSDELRPCYQKLAQGEVFDVRRDR